VRLRPPRGRLASTSVSCCGPPCLRPGRDRRGRGAPAAAHGRGRHAGRWRDAGRDRAGPAACPARYHGHLRQGRPARPVAAGLPLAREAR
jgi:hypothetical protein